MLRVLTYILISFILYSTDVRASHQSCPAKNFDSAENYIFENSDTWEKSAQKFEKEINLMGKKMLQTSYKGDLPDIKMPTIQESAQGLSDKGIIDKTTLQSVVSKKSHPLYVFISLSMKGASIQSVLEQARTYGATVVIRGLKNNSFPDTIGQFAQWIKKYKKGVMLHPKLFETYKVKEVPTIVLVGEGDSYDKIVGNVTLSYALDKFSKEGDAHLRAREILKESRA